MISALSGQATFNVAGTYLIQHPDVCALTVVFSQVNATNGAVYAKNLGSGWTAAEGPPSLAVQGTDSNLHQQLIVPPAAAYTGEAWQGYAQLNTGAVVNSGYYSLSLQGQSAGAQTWLVNGGQLVACSSQ